MLFESVGPRLQGNAHFLTPLYELNISVYSRIHMHLCFSVRGPEVRWVQRKGIFGHREGAWV